jgi:hypothetical protein
MSNSKISALPAATTPLGGTELVPVVQGGITEQVSVANLTAGRAVDALSFASTTDATFATTSGNVGVGTASPGNKLTVFLGTNNSTIARITGGQIAKGLVISTYASNGNDGGISLASTDALSVFTASAERVRVAATGDTTLYTGNLVIGTSGKGIDFSATAGTGTSELLADYEEGTWTPVVSDASTGGNTATVGTTAGTYTKIGRQVTVRLSLDNITTTGMTAANQLFVQGLPYTAASGVAQAPGAMYVSRISFTGGAYSWTASVAASATVMAFFSPTGADSNAASMKVSNILSTGADLYATVTYFV